MVTLGNFKPLIGWVEITDETGLADQLLKALLINMAAIAKLTKTLMVQSTFPHLDSALLMWTSPWRLDASRNSLMGFTIETLTRTGLWSIRHFLFITNSPIMPNLCILIFDKQILKTCSGLCNPCWMTSTKICGQKLSGKNALTMVN